MKRFVALACILITACTPASRFSQYNAAVIYQGDEPESLPEYRIFHTDEARSRVYFSIPSKNLLYVSKNEGAYTARVKLSWEVVPSLDDLSLIDSGSVVLEDQRPQPEEGEIFGYLKIKSACPPKVNRILLLLTLTDLNRKNTQTRMLEISRINHQDKQYFLLTDTAGNPLMNDFIRPGTAYKIQHAKGASVNLHIRHYNRRFPVAEPPYSEDVIKSFQYKADSTFTLHSDSAISFDLPGFYHVQIHDSLRTGLTLFAFPKGYPTIQTARSMGESLRYLTTQKEYDQLTTGGGDTLRKSVEQFWLRAAGNADRARVAIREYYSRIE